MAQYLIQDTTITNIANAIREKTGSSGGIYPESMPAKIRSIQSGTEDTAGIDQGVVDEANRVVNSVLSKIAANSITFIAISDMHEMGDSDHSTQSILDTYRLANAHAGQAAELIAKKVKTDFFVNLGDLAWGLQTYTVHDMAQSITNARVKTGGLERLTKCFATPGNHDIGYRAGNFDENLVKAMIGNYQYADFDDKKIRVIIANTSDISDGTDRASGVSGEQLQWFAEALDLSTKTDASNWGILIFSHHPLDWDSTTMPLANCVAKYVQGGTYSTTHDGISVSKNYSGKNSAKIIGTFHGHVHCFKVGDLSTTTGDNSVKRIAIPNACSGRNNEYGRDGNTTFGEPAADTCPTDGGPARNGSRKWTVAGYDTAFCVVTIDFDEEVIYADCFGSLGDTAPGSHAGYDRVISYGVVEIETCDVTCGIVGGSLSNAGPAIKGQSFTTEIIPDPGYAIEYISVSMDGLTIDYHYSDGVLYIPEVLGDIFISGSVYRVDPFNVIYNLTNVTSSNIATNVAIGGTFTTNINPNDGYNLSSIKIIVGTEDVTTSVYQNGVITIENVWNDIIIIAIATKPEEIINLVPISLTPGDSTSVFNSVGYMDGKYISENGTGTVTGYTSIGAIYLPDGVSSIYIRGCDWDDTIYSRMYFGSKETNNAFGSFLMCGNAGVSGSTLPDKFFTVEKLGDKYYKFTLNSQGIANLYARYYRLSVKGSGANLIVTHDQPIPDSDSVSYIINYALTNVTSSNSIASVTAGSAYTATLTANVGYTLNNVTVTMGGVNVTSSVYSNGIITIDSVTSNIVITATAVQKPSYTNLVTTSINADGSQYMPPNGYQDYYRLNSSGGTTSTDVPSANCGFIPYNGEVIRVWGTTSSIVGNTGNYIMMYDATFKFIGGVGMNNAVASGATWTEKDGKYMFTLDPASITNTTTKNNLASAKYIRASMLQCKGADLVVTLNEPIVENGGNSGTYTVTNTLTNVTSNNSAASVTAGSAYSATLTAKSGYTLTGGTVKIIMGGTDITSSVYSNGTITIDSVTGNVVIIATAKEDEVVATYTNQVPISMDYDGSGVFNGVGYMNNYYATTDAPYYKADTQGCCVTGIIPYNSNNPQTIYIKGVGFTTSKSHNRIGFFKDGICKTTPGVSSLANYFTITNLGTNYYKLVPITGSAMTKWGYDGGINISAYGDGANMIVTLNEPIE